VALQVTVIDTVAARSAAFLPELQNTLQLPKLLSRTVLGKVCSACMQEARGTDVKLGSRRRTCTHVHTPLLAKDTQFVSDTHKPTQTANTPGCSMQHARTAKGQRGPAT
jgi:hypothetical protein